MTLRPFVPVLAIALLTASSAHATDLFGGGMLKLTLKLPPENSTGGAFTEPSTTYLPKYFNQARCLCDASGEEQEYQIEYTWATPPTTTPMDTPIEIWAGQNCDSDVLATRDMNCTHLESPGKPANLPASGVYRVNYRVSELVTPPTAAGTDRMCPATVVPAQHYAVSQTGSIWNDENVTSLGSPITADMAPPEVPTNISATAKESGIRLTWTPLLDTGIQFQALCSKADGTAAHGERTNAPLYETPRTLCGLSTDALVTPVNVDGVAASGTLPSSLAQLDQGFICGQASAGAGAIELSGLDNGAAYWVVVLAIDRAGNAAGFSVDRPIEPVPVTDFWEEANNENGNLRGGFCVAQVGDDSAAGSAALVVIAAFIAARRRRRRRRDASTLAKAALLGLVLAPGIASAQPTYSPSWLEEAPPVDTVATPTWTLGFRFGPYHPSVDDHFDSDPGPYARVFKKDTYMFAVDAHRVWNLARGQLGIGLTGGYHTNSALAFVDGTAPTTPDRDRADGNLTRLSIVPLQLTAIYRATIFDDELGIPLVPYLRGGLAYYVWWSRAPSGGFSVAMSCTTCEDRALGGTLGVVAAAGLAIRAERIDGDAARSMRDSGLEHAGFYAEVEGAWVDGFGSKQRLAVGDVTWFGGINFEF